MSPFGGTTRVHHRLLVDATSENVIIKLVTPSREEGIAALPSCGHEVHLGRRDTSARRREA